MISEPKLVAICGCGMIQSIHKDWSRALGESVHFHCEHCGVHGEQLVAHAVVIDVVETQDPYEREAAKAAVNTLTRDNERLRTSRSQAENILDNIDEIMSIMKPRFVGGVSMDGKLPYWRVWLPKEGTTDRKTLKQALVDFMDQSEPFPS